MAQQLAKALIRLLFPTPNKTVKYHILDPVIKEGLGISDMVGTVRLMLRLEEWIRGPIGKRLFSPVFSFSSFSSHTLYRSYVSRDWIRGTCHFVLVMDIPSFSNPVEQGFRFFERWPAERDLELSTFAPGGSFHWIPMVSILLRPLR